jgi:ACS family tartrate transporter-like MFS transporter
MGEALRNPPVLLLAATNFLVTSGHYGIEAFLPTILQNWFHLERSEVAWAAMPSFLTILAAQLGVSWSSDRCKERWWHTAVPMFWGAGVLVLATLARGSLVLTVLAFALALGGIRSYVAPFYALPKLFLDGTAAAGAIGFINAIANLGGFVGPRAVGSLAKSTGSFAAGLIFLAAMAALAGTCVLTLRAYDRRRRTTPLERQGAVGPSSR